MSEKNIYKRNPTPIPNEYSIYMNRFIGQVSINMKKFIVRKEKKLTNIILRETTIQEDVGKERKIETTYKQVDNAGCAEEGAEGSMEES